MTTVEEMENKIVWYHWFLPWKWNCENGFHSTIFLKHKVEKGEADAPSKLICKVYCMNCGKPLQSSTSYIP